MEKWRFERCKQILKDYPGMDKKIKEIEESIRVPHKPDDVNAGIRGTKTETDSMLKTLWIIDSHKALNELKRNKKAVETLLNESDEDTKMIIKELYIRKIREYTLAGLCNKELINCKKTKATRLRNQFFEELDKML